VGLFRHTGGDRDDLLAAAYRRCQLVHRRHGRTYYLATRLLPAWKRRHVHALYGFTRTTDDLVDGPTGSTDDRQPRLRAWTERFAAALGGADVADPILPAVVHTIDRFDLDPADFQRFLRSMAMDLTVTGYQTFDELADYMAGSAAAVGTMMLPILGAADLARAREPARQLGIAFQLTNFVRDVGEDLDRGRIYLPREDLDRFGVAEADLRTRRMSGAVRALLAFEVDRAREHYTRAASGIGLLDPSSRACIRVASRLYGGILDQVVAAGYDVFRQRARVPVGRRIAVAASELLSATSGQSGGSASGSPSR
jgi:15-cis-phytoene synthase